MPAMVLTGLVDQLAWRGWSYLFHGAWL